MDEPPTSHRQEGEPGEHRGDRHEQPAGGERVDRVGGDGVPTIATHAASPSAAPIWRHIVCTPIPVESCSGRSVAAAVAVKDGSIRPTPMPVSTWPGRISLR